MHTPYIAVLVILQLIQEWGLFCESVSSNKNTIFYHTADSIATCNSVSSTWVFLYSNSIIALLYKKTQVLETELQ